MHKGGKMGADYWASRIHSAKHLSAFHLAKHIGFENHLVLDDSELREDARIYFTCPFCYIDTELSLLCSHLQEEHCFDVEDTVCPVCEMDMGKDVVSHFRVHHVNSLENPRKSQKCAFWSNDVRDLSSFCSLAARAGFGNLQDSSPDPLLAPFLCSVVPYSDLKAEQSQDTSCSNMASVTSNTESSKNSDSSEPRGKDYEERIQKAEFFQQLMFSTMV